MWIFLSTDFCIFSKNDKKKHIINFEYEKKNQFRILMSNISDIWKSRQYHNRIWSFKVFITFIVSYGLYTLKEKFLLKKSFVLSILVGSSQNFLKKEMYCFLILGWDIFYTQWTPHVDRFQFIWNMYF